jgi:SAM-dependent methyltransferase
MDLQRVRDAYPSMSEPYIALVEDARQMPEQDRSLIRRHLAGVSGAVLDLGCGPGHWTAYLHSLGVDVSGIDLVPDFIPVAGYADDVLVVAWVLRSVVRAAGAEAIDRHWPGTPQGLGVVRRLAGVRAAG